MAEPIKLVYCYARVDEIYLQKLQKHLRPLQYANKIEPWFDRLIKPGADYAKEIDTHLDAAQLILLLVSADFIDSKYCYGVELEKALQRHDRGEVHVIPIIVRPCIWQSTPIRKLQALPTDSKPITDPQYWPNEDVAWAKVAEGVQEVVFSQSVPTQQRLWYTAPAVRHSDSRIGKGGEGFRICAVTPELNEDIYTGDAQIRALERYARYAPPDGTTWDDASHYGEQGEAPMPPDLDGLCPNDSPICLSLIDIQNPEVLDSPMLAEKLSGRVLVNKVYLGEAHDGREGNFFSDLLSHLPKDFSAREALALWRSNFWQRFYYSAASSPNFRDELRSVELPLALLQELNSRRLSQTPEYAASSVLSVGIQDPNEKLPNPFAKVSPSPETMMKLEKLLTFLIHAYLLQQDEEWTERSKQAARLARLDGKLDALQNLKSKKKEREREESLEAYRQMRVKRIYLAAEDDQVAYCLMLLANLFQGIPALLQPLTFSTYEYDVLKSECLIVATSPSRAWEKNRTRLETLLPPECEKLGFVYNSYDGVRNTQLPHYCHNQPVPLPVGAVARDLARNLLKPTKRFDKYPDVVINQITESALSPALQVVHLWQKQLPQLLQKDWRTHLLFVTEALDCLDDWGDALTLVDEESLPFQPELLRELEKPERVHLLQGVIRQQMSTKQPDNKDVVFAFYRKLLQCGYSETATLLLLETWHETWYQGYISNEKLRIILNITTNLSQTALRHLQLRYKETYKAKQAEVILGDLYKRYIWQGNEEQRKGMLFELLEGRFASQERLDALLPVAQLSTLGKVEFLARFGPTSLPEYFRHPRQERSKELLKLFISLTEEYQDLPDQTLKLGQPLVPVDRPVLLAILSLWLAATPFAEAGTIQFLIDRAILDWVNAPSRKNNRPQKELAREELASILATFGSQYMASGKRELREICWQYFQWLCSNGELSSALKLQMCMTLLPPDLFPFTTTPLSLDETLHILNTAHLAHEPTTSPFVNELRRHLAKQKNIAHIRAGQLTTFLAQQGRSVEQFSQQLQDFLAQSSGRASEPSETLEAFLRKQVPARTSYWPTELELFLEIQEYRGKALRSEISGMPLAIYLHYVDSPEKKRAEPCRELYQRYLRNTQIENLERRQETIELLKSLSGTPVEALDKTINVLAEGLLVLVDFLQSASRQQKPLARRVAEKDTPPLSTTMLKNLKSSLSSLKEER